MSRPEDQLPPELFYSPTEAQKYTSSSRIQSIQASMTHRALSLLNLSGPSFILDIGCGSGLSGGILSSIMPPMGPHTWVGMDISPAMLATALTRTDEPQDLFLADMGAGVPFRPGTFDAAISISALQWLCAAPATDDSAAPELRLRRFFNALYAALRRGARAVCQFYAADAAQRAMIEAAAIRAGFGAGVLEDAPGTKNAKTYLVLTVGGTAAVEGGDIAGVVAGLEGVEVMERRKGKVREKGRHGAKGGKGGRDWILKKKARMEKQGKVVKRDSKYTGRSRGPKF